MFKVSTVRFACQTDLPLPGTSPTPHDWRLRKALEAAREGRTSFAIAHRLSTIQNCTLAFKSEGQEPTVLQDAVQRGVAESGGFPNGFWVRM